MLRKEPLFWQGALQRLGMCWGRLGWEPMVAARAAAFSPHPSEAAGSSTTTDAQVYV
jgi:hypothetical protein